MDTNKIKAVIIAVVATFIALYLGISAATAQFETMAWVLGIGILILGISLGRRIWMLIPFMFALNIGLRIPGQPDSTLLGQVLVLGFCVPLFLIRKLPYKLVWTELEFWILILTLLIGQVYIRNPVGVNLFGGSTVGGKPYALFAIGVVCALLLAGLRIPTGELKWILRLSIIGGLLNLVISISGGIFPAIAYYTGATLTHTDEANYENFGQVVDTGAATRVSYLTEFGKNLSLWISSYISPLRALLNPFWACLVITALVATMMGGFRSGLFAAGINFLLGIAYRSGTSGIMLSVFGAFSGLILLISINEFHPLPPNIQRSLTILPGTWEQRYKDDAHDSTEWRIEIWREVLLTDRWISNKWIGDGLGFSAAELRAQTNSRKNTRAGISGFDASREAILANGNYHSSYVSSIRTVGYIGLLFFIVAQLRLAVHAHRLIISHRHDEYYGLCLFVGIPCMAAPILLIISATTFLQVASTLLFGIGMIRLLKINIPSPESTPIAQDR
jgi:hypothetical protein